MKRISRSAKHIIIETLVILVCLTLLLIGMIADKVIQICKPAPSILFLDVNYYRSLLTTIAGIQASIICIGFSFIAIISSFKTDEYLGINYFRYISRYRNKILSFKIILIAEFILEIISLLCLFFELLNLEFFSCTPSIILLSYFFVETIHLLDTKSLHNDIFEFLKLNIGKADNDFLDKYASWVTRNLNDNTSEIKQTDYFVYELWTHYYESQFKEGNIDDKNKKSDDFRKNNRCFSIIVSEYLKKENSTELNDRGIEICKSIITTYCNQSNNMDIIEQCIHDSVQIWAAHLADLYFRGNKQEIIEEIRRELFNWEGRIQSSERYKDSRKLLDSIIIAAKKQPAQKTSNLLAYRAKMLVNDARWAKDKDRSIEEAIHFILESASNGFVDVIEKACFSDAFDTIQKHFPQLICIVVAYLFYLSFIEEDEIIKAKFNSLDQREVSKKILRDNLGCYSHLLQSVDFDFINDLSNRLLNYEIIIPGIMKYERISFRLPLTFVFLIGIASPMIPYDYKKIIGKEPNSINHFWNYFVYNVSYTESLFNSVFNELKFAPPIRYPQEKTFNYIRLNVLNAIFEIKTEEYQSRNIRPEIMQRGIEVELNNRIKELEIKGSLVTSNDSTSQPICYSSIVEASSSEDSYCFEINRLIAKIARNVFEELKKNKKIQKLNVQDEFSLSYYCEKTNSCDFVLGGNIFCYGSNIEIISKVESLQKKSKYIDILLEPDERIDAFKNRISISFSNITATLEHIGPEDEKISMEDIQKRYIKCSQEEYLRFIEEKTIIDYINSSLFRLTLSCDVTVSADNDAGYCTTFQFPQ